MHLIRWLPCPNRWSYQCKCELSISYENSNLNDLHFLHQTLTWAHRSGNIVCVILFTVRRLFFFFLREVSRRRIMSSAEQVWKWNPSSVSFHKPAAIGHCWISPFVSPAPPAVLALDLRSINGHRLFSHQASYMGKGAHFLPREANTSWLFLSHVLEAGMQSWDPGLNHLLPPEAVQLVAVMQRSVEGRLIALVTTPSALRVQWSQWLAVGGRYVWAEVVSQLNLTETYKPFPHHSNLLSYPTFFFLLRQVP